MSTQKRAAMVASLKYQQPNKSPEPTGIVAVSNSQELLVCIVVGCRGIRLGLIVAGVAVALISPLFLLVVLVIGSLILYASLPYRLRGLLFTTLFSRDLSHHKKHDHDA
jgi:F0F1-type ATP synthase assembly protein I